MKKFLATILSMILILTIIPMAYAEENNTYKVGDIIQFGSYPQSEVKDETLVAELNVLAPEWEEWTSYGYYSGTGEYGTMKQGNWMRYTDVIYNGNKYRGVKFTEYRPCWSYYSSSEITIQDSNGYTTNTEYWFKFEPIEWRVLDPNTGLVMCETIIDSQAYSNTSYYNESERDSKYAYFNDLTYKNYASDYETSSIRQWLNYDFYNTAFTDSEKKEINITTLNNDCAYTSVGVTGYEKLDSKATEDKIFLLSVNELRNSDFGFDSDTSVEDTSRLGKGSDYALSQGLLYNDYYNSAEWLLRSAGRNSECSWIVGSDGSFDGHSYYVFHTCLGVRPAFKFIDIGQLKHQHSYTSKITTLATHLKKGIKTFTCKCGDSYTEEIAKLEGHTYNQAVTAPTCTAQGYTTYTCVCGDTYIADYVNALGHKDNNGDYKCDNGCGYEFEKPAPEEPSKDCSCNCHKGGIMGFFWKIINFFNKLFKSKQYCGCGAKHW